jgi:hypothetical protein
LPAITVSLLGNDSTGVDIDAAGHAATGSVPLATSAAQGFVVAHERGFEHDGSTACKNTAA